MDIYEEIVALRRAGRKAALATIINVRGSIPSFRTAKLLVRDDGSTLGTVGGGCVEAEVWQAAREVIEQEKARTLTFDLNSQPSSDTGLVCGGTLEVFVEPIIPSAELYIFGAGHVARSLYRVAEHAGFEITVVDDRVSYANREHFPNAKAIVVQAFERAFEQLTPSESAFIVIVTRGHHDDMTVLRRALDTRVRYIGMIGSKRKVLSIYRELERQGVSPSKLDERLHAPIGLDIGAATPEEIGVAIVAELIAVKHRAEDVSRKRFDYQEYLRSHVSDPASKSAD